MLSVSIESALSMASTPQQVSSPKGSEGGFEARTFDYFGTLPYAVESEKERLDQLAVIIQKIQLGVLAEDYEGLAMEATRQLERWLSLKFEMPKQTLIKLIHFYWKLALIPGLMGKSFERFALVFAQLAR